MSGCLFKHPNSSAHVIAQGPFQSCSYSRTKAEFSLSILGMKHHLALGSFQEI